MGFPFYLNLEMFFHRINRNKKQSVQYNMNAVSTKLLSFVILCGHADPPRPEDRWDRLQRQP